MSSVNQEGTRGWLTSPMLVTLTLTAPYVPGGRTKAQLVSGCHRTDGATSWEQSKLKLNL